ncbi:MAG: protein kinase, partial [Planctomycetota bacterium]
MTDDLAKTAAVKASVGSLRDQQLAKLLEDYMESLERGAPLDLETLAAERPELADELRGFGESLHVLHDATRNLRGPLGDASTDVSSGARRLGDFEIGPEIGRGGMGVVYEARQISLDRRVALKVLPFAAVWDQKQIARFRNEAQAAAQLQHPNIVPVYAVGQERGVHFYAMQLINGQSLEAALTELRRDADGRARHSTNAVAASTLRRCASTVTWSRKGEAVDRAGRWNLV